MTFSRKIIFFQIALWLVQVTHHAFFMIIGRESFNISGLLIGEMLMAAVYFINYFILLPVFFIDKKIKSKIAWFILFNILFVLLFMTFSIFHGVLCFESGQIDSPLDHPWDMIPYYIYILLGSTGFRMAVHWNKTTEEIRKIEEERFNDEAKRIINQGTTSFINKNIPELIALSKSNPDSLKKAIIYFSELLRYSLYQKNLVSLSVELEMVSEFTKLCRQLSGTFELHLQANGEIKNVLVMPMTIIFRIQQAIHESKNEMNGNYKVILNLKSDSIESILISDRPG